MTENTISTFLMQNAKFFTPAHQTQIKQMLANEDESKLTVLQAVSFKDPTTMLIISLVTGALAVDRFMLGQVGLGIAKLLTIGGCGIWTIIDFIKIQDMTREYNFEQFKKALGLM